MSKNYKDYTKEDCKKLNGWGWSWLLSHQPQFAKYCNWDKLDGFNWNYLLSKQPQFAKYCNWNKLDRNDWAVLLIKQPQFKDSIYYKGWKLKNM